MLSRKNASVCMFLCLGMMLHAQSESKKDSIPILGKGKITVIGKDKPVDGTSVSESRQSVLQTNENNYPVPGSSVSESPGKITYKLPAVNYFPKRLLEENTTTRFPFANDYSYSGIQVLDANSWLSGGTDRKTLPTFGIIQQTALQYNRIFNNKLILSGGISGKKMEMHERQYGDLKANLGMDWLMSNRLTMECLRQLFVDQGRRRDGQYDGFVYPL
jgi:hypothetical protein